MTMRKVIGSTGGNTPVRDGAARGGLLAAITAVLTVLADRGFLGLTLADIGTAAPALVFVTAAAWGVIDRIDGLMRARLQVALDKASSPEGRMEAGDPITPGDGL